MRKLPAVLAVLGLSAVGLAGCGIPAGYDACSRPDATGTSTDFVTVSGDLGSEPDITVRTPLHVDSTQVSDLETGAGNAITSDNQAVVIDLTIVSGATGEVIASTGYRGDQSQVIPMDQWLQSVPAFETALHCATEGSRIVVALPPGGIAAEAAASIGLKENDSAVAVVDVQKVYLPSAQGTLVYNDALGLPTVVRAPDGRPGVIVPDATAPDELVAQTLIRGAGPTVSGDDNVRIHYTSVSWDDRDVLDTTWDGDPQSTTLETIVPGAVAKLGDVTVGSQLLIVEPSGEDKEAPARVFVIDILGVDQAAAQ